MKKSVAVFLAALLVAVLTVAAVAAAVAGARKRAGSVTRETVDRVDLTVEGTEQTFSLADGESFVAELTLTAAKTEADFYVMVNEISVQGEGVEKTEVVPIEAEGGYRSASGAVLPAKDGKPLPLRWTVRVYFSAEKAGKVPALLSVDLTSGVKKDAADRRLWTADLTFRVEG